MMEHEIASTTHHLAPTPIVEIALRSAADTRGEGQIQVRIYTDCALASRPPMLWDVIESTGWTRADSEHLLQWAKELPLPFSVDRSEALMAEKGTWFVPPPEPKERALWRYHPLRLIESMPWGKDVARIGFQMSAGPTQQGLQALTATLGREMNAAFALRPLRTRAIANPSHGRAYMRYTNVLIGAGAFVGAGKQIYDFPPALTEMFRNTDVDDIAFEHVKVPYSAIYMHFGRQIDMPLGDGWFAEGAYVNEIRNIETGDRYCNISIVSGHESFSRFLAIDQGLEPNYTIAIEPVHQSMALAEAVELILSEKMAILQKDIDGEERMKAEVDAQIARGELPPGAVSAQSRNSRQELDSLMPRHESFLKMLRLVVNALVYTNAYPDDIDEKWPEKTPATKLRELKKAKGRKETQRVQSELAKLGFSPVHLCGAKAVSQMQQQKPAGNEEGRTVALHWVRGHWRRQAHGPGHALRKIIWRMPLMRGTRHSEDEEPLGHIYLAS